MSPFEEALLLSVGQSVHRQFPFIFFSLVAYTEMKCGIQIYLKNIEIKVCFWYKRAIFDRVMPLGLRKNSNDLQFPIIFFAEIAHI
jgi:hypothetical protein